MFRKRAGPGAVARAEAQGFIRMNRPSKFNSSTPPFWVQRHAAALQKRGPRLLGQFLVELILAGGHDFERELAAALGRYNGIPVATHRALNADWFPPPFAMIDGRVDDPARR
jgi:hypothetical protein